MKKIILVLLLLIFLFLLCGCEDISKYNQTTYKKGYGYIMFGENVVTLDIDTYYLGSNGWITITDKEGHIFKTHIMNVVLTMED